MRKVLLSAAMFAGATLAGLAVSACTPAVAQPYEGGYAYGSQPGGIVEFAQYDWRWRERERRHEEWERWRRHEEWRHRHGEYEQRGW